MLSSTTNGSRMVVASHYSPCVVMGSFCNATAVVNFLKDLKTLVFMTAAKNSIVKEFVHLDINILIFTGKMTTYLLERNLEELLFLHLKHNLTYILNVL